jgi:MFS family permease
MDARRTMSDLSSGSARLYHGWFVVAAAFLVALFGWGLGFYGPGIYLVALSQIHGWSAADISSAITAYYVLGAALVFFFLGLLYERFGARRVVGFGALAMVAGVVLLTFVSRLWHVYAAFAVMSFGWAAMSGAAINIIIAPWFARRRGLAISLALNGASAGGVVMAPLLTFLIGRFGFAAALWTASALMLAVLLPVVMLVLRRKRADEDHYLDSVIRAHGEAKASASAFSFAAALRDKHFLTIAIPFALGLTAQVGFLTHQVAFLSPHLGTVGAGWGVSLTTFAAIVGRLATGLFVDKVSRRATACGNFLVQVAGLGILVSAQSPAALYLGCALFGLGLGNLVSLPGLIVQQEFSPVHFARIVSMIVAINQFTFAFGPDLLGRLQEWGGYSTALAACLVTDAVAAVIVLSARRVPTSGRSCI